jgi:hypothetical protein
MGAAVNKLAAKMLVVRFATIHVVVPPHMRVREGKREDVDGYEYDRDVKTGREVPGSRQPLPKEGGLLGAVKRKLAGPQQNDASLQDFAAKNRGWAVEEKNGPSTSIRNEEQGVTITFRPGNSDERSVGRRASGSDLAAYYEVRFDDTPRPVGGSRTLEEAIQVVEKGSPAFEERDEKGNSLYQRDERGRAEQTEHHPAKKAETEKKRAEYQKRQEEFANPDPKETGTEVEKFADLFGPGGGSLREKKPGLTDEQLATIREAAEDARKGDFAAALEKLDAINTSPEMRKLSDWAFDKGYRTKAEKGRESSRSRGDRRRMVGALGGPNGWSDWLNRVRAAAAAKSSKTKPGGSK